MVETFMGQNFSSVLYFIGCDFCHLPNISSILTDEVSIDKVCWDLLIDPEAFFKILNCVMATFFDLHLKV